MTDLVKRLRCLGDHASFEPHMHHTAADRIEKLEAQLARSQLKRWAARWEEQSDRIEKLEAYGKDLRRHWLRLACRIEKLEAALREIIQEDALTGKTVFVGDFGKIARKALEGKDD